MTHGSDTRQGRRFIEALPFVGAFLVLALFMSCEPRHALGVHAYQPGDSLHIEVTAFDSSGALFDMDSVRVIISRNGVDFDSVGFGGAVTGMTKDGTGRYEDTYVVPSTWGSENNFDIEFTPLVWGDGYTRGWARMDPERVQINAPLNLFALNQSTASSEYAIVDTTDCTNCGAYLGGNGITGAVVYATTQETAFTTTASGILAHARTVDGFWSMVVPLNAGAPDTVYAYVTYQGTIEGPYEIGID